MNNKKGFTLVELLSVIAILTILVLIALPNIVGFFTSSKMNSFKNEVQSAYSASEEKWVKDHITHRGEIVYAKTANNNCELSLDLSGRQTFNYYIKMNNKGKIIEYYAEDGIYQYIYTGDGLKKEDITEVVEMSKINITDRINVTCDGKVQQTEPTYTLTVNPNGGTWNGSSSSQTFNQKAGTTKTIDAPTDKYIKLFYYDNGQGVTINNAEQNLELPFDRWNLSGGGSLSGTTYTFGDNNATLTASYSPITITLVTVTKSGYNCKWAEGSTTGTQYPGGTQRILSADTKYYLKCYSTTPVTLTVNPNGGSWEGSTSTKTFTQLDGTTKTISNPSNRTLNITYYPNGQDATFDGNLQSSPQLFNKWILTGGGSLDGTTYTFGDTNATLSAIYYPASVVLKAISKTGYTCKWASGSSSGTQYAGGTNMTLGSSMSFYAICNGNYYNLTIYPNGGIWNGSSTTKVYSQKINTSKTIVDPTRGPGVTVSFNANGQGITAPSTMTVYKNFSSWTVSSYGSWDPINKKYTFGAGNGNLWAYYYGAPVTLPSVGKTGYTCKWAMGSASGTQYNGGTTVNVNSNTTFYAVCSANTSTLTINPYGGTWNGSSSSQSFTQAIDTTKHIPDSVGQAFTVSYNSNGQNVTVPSSITIHKQFTSWSRSGAGSFNAPTKIYTFGAGNGSLIANYNVASLTLPSVSKTNYTCKWAKGTNTGPQFEAGTNVEISANTTFYAVCTPNSITFIPTTDTIPTTTCGTETVTNAQTFGDLKACTPQKMCHTFDGWWTSATGGTRITENTPLSSLPNTVYAHWTSNVVDKYVTLRCGTEGCYYPWCVQHAQMSEADGNQSFQYYPGDHVRGCITDMAISGDGTKPYQLGYNWFYVIEDFGRDHNYKPFPCYIGADSLCNGEGCRD